MARRLRQVVDLYTLGKVSVLLDGTPVWVQPLNPFEQDTARNEALIAKSRIMLAIREFGSEEQNKVRMFFFEDGIDRARELLIDAKVTDATPKIFDSIRNDPEWTERLSIIDRGGENTATPLEDVEIKLINKASQEFAAELGQRVTAEREFLHTKYDDMGEDDLFADYLAWFIERRGTDLMMAEFRLHQILFGVRWCEGTDHGDNTWTHENCAGHQEKMFDSLTEVRTAPEELLSFLQYAVDDIDMAAREAKNSRRQGSSSGSSPLPSEEAALTASTQSEAQPEPPGSSVSPSPTPSPSLAGQS